MLLILQINNFLIFVFNLINNYEVEISKVSEDKMVLV